MDRTRIAVSLLALASLSGCAECWEDWLEHHGPHGGGGGSVDAGSTCSADQYAHGDGACVRKASSISVGFAYACATLQGGALKCWGSNASGFGVLGYGPQNENRGDAPGELGSNLPAINLGTGLSATQVSAGIDLTCALLDTGSAKCWGYDGYQATKSGVTPPVNGRTPDTLGEWSWLPLRLTQVRAGSGSGMGILEDGSFESWGFHGVDFGGVSIASFDRGSSYDNWQACGLAHAGDVLCVGVAGAWSSGALGYVRTSDAQPTPVVALGTGRSALSVAAGNDFTCALLDDHSVKCWGANAHGQLGQGDTAARGLTAASMGDALLPVPLGQPALAITAGVSHACAILNDGSVRCWGGNDHGQLGIGSTASIGDAPGAVAALSPVPLGSGRTAVAIDAANFSCALLDDGSVKCWGANDFGQLGQGDVVERGSTPGQLGDALPAIDLGP